MHLPILLFYIAVFLVILCYIYKDNSEGYSKGDSEGYSKGDSKGDSEGNSCSGSGYKKLNMSSDSSWKCNCCTTYGSLFDYKKQLGDQTYGVHNGCQKIF